MLSTEGESPVFGGDRFVAPDVKCADFYAAEQTAGNFGFHHAIDAPGESRAAKGGKQDCATGYAKKSRTPHKCLLFCLKVFPNI